MKTKITRREMLRLSAVTVGAALLPGALSRTFAADAAANDAGKRNVLFIMTDQQRTDTIRCYGNPRVHTPALDALAQSGARFTSCYTSQPVCTPCRGSIITGKYPTAIDVWENNRPLMDHSTSWLRILGAEGYKTCYVGKWHLGNGKVGPDYVDDWHGYETGWPHWFEDPATKERRYRPDAETDYAMAFMSKHRESPFACFVSYYPPHTPKHAPDENVRLYEGVFEEKGQRIYHAMVNRIDWNIGRLLKFLDDSGLRENTVIVFTSDHGENYPLRWNKHLKRLCYDQAANVPLIVCAPGVTKPGATFTAPVNSVDLCPTILDLLGHEAPPGMHGESMRALLTGNAGTWRTDTFIQNRPFLSRNEQMERCVVTDRWKLILNQERAPELYDRQAETPDHENLYNVADPSVRKDLLDRLAQWGKRVEDPLVDQLVAASAR